MNEKELRRRLRELAVPGERDAAEHAWSLVSAAFAEREPVRRRRAGLRPALALAAVLALLGAALSPPGRAVLDTVRERVIGVAEADPALFRLPAPGRLLVVSETGSWVVHADGSKRLLPGYRQASWSPHGLFVVAVRGDDLAALEPDGRVRWSLARPAIRHPRWGGTRTDTRIAYLSEGALRVVAGDGTGDRRLAARARPVAPAWRPGEGHLLAYVAADGSVVVADENGRTRWRRDAGSAVALEWAQDGNLLLVRGERSLAVLGDDGEQRFELLRDPPAGPVTAASFGPDGRSVAFVQQVAGESHLWVVPELRPDAAEARRVFSGEGAFSGLAWSPDGRWLLLAWEDADQWVFVESARVRGLEAVSNVSRQFGGSFPELGRWCCAPSGETAPLTSLAAAAAPPRHAARAAPPPQPKAPAAELAVVWRRSTALGLPHAGRLVAGVELPGEGATFFTWHPIRRSSPNARWRRYGTDRVVRTVLRILDEHAAANPGAPRVGVGDLSLPQGGPFGPKHVSHQNGLDVDVYFPRRDRRERPPDRPEEIDLALAQDLVDRFVAAGAQRVFVGPRTGLKGPPSVVQVLAHHDNHLHARFPNG